MFGSSWAALRQELADTMDHALDTYWATMRGADPDAMLLVSQTEVHLVAKRRLPRILKAHMADIHAPARF